MKLSRIMSLVWQICGGTEMEQLILHGIGDFFLQSDWMALNKKKPGFVGWLAVSLHSLLYTLPFLLVTQSLIALWIIYITHLIIDRTNIIANFIWARNWVGLPWIKVNDKKIINRPWAENKTNFGFDTSRPVLISFWLYVICDNMSHLIINYLCIKYL